jgi:hypothetical protein
MTKPAAAAMNEPDLSSCAAAKAKNNTAIRFNL